MARFVSFATYCDGCRLRVEVTAAEAQRCGVMGVDVDGRCIRCGLEPDYGGTLPCPTGFLAHVTSDAAELVRQRTLTWKRIEPDVGHLPVDDIRRRTAPVKHLCPACQEGN